MRIAILGATSQIAQDLTLSFSMESNHELALFARRRDAVMGRLSGLGLTGRYTVADFDAFSMAEHFDAILNFIGVGNPAQAALMGASIFNVTLQYDDLALSYVNQHPDCRYLFLSSGAAYGSMFEEPADENTKAVVEINNLRSQDWYGVAKLHAECRHRSLPHLSIVDIRVFNYFSRTYDPSARFLISDIIRSIFSDSILQTSSDNIVRDYLGPQDFFGVISAVLAAAPMNGVFDCYSKAPVEKFELLAELRRRYGLVYEIVAAPPTINATGEKIKYFSTNRRLSTLGYLPAYTSLEGICIETAALLGAAEK